MISSSQDTCGGAVAPAVPFLYGERVCGRGVEVKKRRRKRRRKKKKKKKETPQKKNPRKKCIKSPNF